MDALQHAKVMDALHTIGRNVAHTEDAQRSIARSLDAIANLVGLTMFVAFGVAMLMLVEM